MTEHNTHVVLEKLTAVSPRDVAFALQRFAGDVLHKDTDEFDRVEMPYMNLLEPPSLENYARAVTRALKYYWSAPRTVCVMAYMAPSSGGNGGGVAVTLAPTVGLAAICAETDP